ncbi:hypothetical protein KP509_1Z320300 [Ceratopteris richardii]|nr:hypothetical protein KP509_1Z320300 [Ceratopteris richardii]
MYHSRTHMSRFAIVQLNQPMPSGEKNFSARKSRSQQHCLRNIGLVFSSPEEVILAYFIYVYPLEY